jgi:hypothetical protein
VVKPGTWTVTLIAGDGHSYSRKDPGIHYAIRELGWTWFGEVRPLDAERVKKKGKKKPPEKL